MTIDAGPDAGSFEPKPMVFYAVTHPPKSFGKALPVKGDRPYCTRYFRWSRTYGTEKVDTGTIRSPQTIIIEIRRDSKTMTLKRDMIGVWNNMDWGIKDIQPKPNSSAFLTVTLDGIPL